jgi:hypothetical protein
MQSCTVVELAQWLYAHANIGDNQLTKLLRTKAKEEKKRGGPKWPKTVHGAWERLNYTQYHKDRVIRVVYCPNKAVKFGRLVCGRRWQQHPCKG